MSTSKKIGFVAAIIIVVAILRPITDYLIKKYATYEINTEIQDEVKNLFSSYGRYSLGVTASDSLSKPPPIQWNDKLIKIGYELSNDGYYYDYFYVSADNGISWNKLNKEETGWCVYLMVYNSKLVCVSSDDVIYLDNNGNKEKEIKFINHKSAIHSQAVYKTGNEVTMVWSDERARWPNFYHYVPTPYSGDTFSGPFLLMVGKLNLDTLDFKEYVIGYNASRLEDIGISPK